MIDRNVSEHALLGATHGSIERESSQGVVGSLLSDPNAVVVTIPLRGLMHNLLPCLLNGVQAHTGHTTWMTLEDSALSLPHRQRNSCDRTAGVIQSFSFDLWCICVSITSAAWCNIWRYLSAWRAGSCANTVWVSQALFDVACRRIRPNSANCSLVKSREIQYVTSKLDWPVQASSLHHPYGIRKPLTRPCLDLQGKIPAPSMGLCVLLNNSDGGDLSASSMSVSFVLSCSVHYATLLHEMCFSLFSQHFIHCSFTELVICLVAHINVKP